MQRRPNGRVRLFEKSGRLLKAFFSAFDQPSEIVR